ncbi:Predicted arabinose efflux permease, MFS family [Allopseudospirillum japonicum]|uniref:Predicted arabinose efflux permease, MFS family n=1 Tax=Allopseudospirillum japonicum TaxID=64971 RepID=A0A1H6UWR4_9GAMM|nr:MFS transporter [Allopseudospirillum japonicum]SEI92402.1 Predicted arabinose efflux permease, MFS family [Allopseudospirillum japonicum]
MGINVWLLAFCQALLTTGNILLVSVTALIGQSLAPSPSLATFPVAMQFIGLMLATLPASLLMQKIGRRLGFLLGNSIGVLGAILACYALWQQSFALFFSATFLLGIAIGFGQLYRFAAVEACAPAKKAQAISIVMGGGVLAALLGPWLAVQSKAFIDEPEFLGSFIGLLALYILALVLVTSLKLAPPSMEEVQGPQRSWPEILRQPALIAALIAGTIGYSVMVLVMTATPLAMQGCGFSFGETASVIQWHVLGMFLPSFITGHLISRFGTYPVMYAGGVCLLISVVINQTGLSYAHFWFGLLMLGLGWNWMFIGATHLLTQTYQAAEKGRVQALNEFVVFSCVSLASIFAGWLEFTLGWAALNLWMLPLIVFALLLLIYTQVLINQSTFSKGDTA